MRTSIQLRSRFAGAAVVLAGLAGSFGCGGSDANTPPQTAASTDTTTTTSSMTNAPVVAAPPPPVATETTTASTTPADGMASSTSPSPSSGMGSAVMTDEQIAAVTNAADAGEVDQAKEAVKKAKSGKVKSFAQHMITDHGAAFKEQNDILRKAGLDAKDNDTSRSVASDGKQILSQLQRTPGGADFDKQYIDAQVKEHQAVLDALDNKLLPNAKNADLRAHLQKVRDKVDMHLKMAKDLQASLK